ncbi:hypothetical protein ACHAQD_008414 [Fusarium lateritium]
MYNPVRIQTHRRMLEYHERQIFTGHPENTRDHMMQVSKALTASERETKNGRGREKATEAAKGNRADVSEVVYRCGKRIFVNYEEMLFIHNDENDDG